MLKPDNVYFQGSYREGFAVLPIPAVLTLMVLTAARFLYARPRELEMTLPELQPKGLTRPFWVYLGATALIGAGYADFPLIAFDFQKAHVVPDHWIPIFYAIAMGVDALAALVAGRLFDRKGMRVLVVAVFLSA